MRKTPLQPCGTVAAYRRHLYYRETPCDDCRAANRAYRRGLPAKGAASPGRVSAECGTYSGYQRHRRRKEPACSPCKEAKAKYQARWRSDPEQKADQYRRQYARERALARLANTYADEYRRNYEEELARDEST